MKNLILGLAILLSCTSCLQREDEPKEDLGREFTEQELNEALAKIEQPDPRNIRKGEFVAYTEVQEIGGIAKNRLSDTGETVVNREEDDELIKLTVMQNKFTYQNDKAEKATTQFEFYVPKNPTEASLAKAHTASPTLKVREVLKSMRPLADSTQKDHFYGLEVQTYMADPPVSVRAQPNCGGMVNCKIKIQRIKFDQVFDKDDGSRDRIMVEFYVSPDVPYFARIMDKCLTAMVPYGNIKTLLRQCSPVENFMFGSP